MQTLPGKTLDLSSVESFSEPFPYFVSPNAFAEEISLTLLKWLEQDAPWKLVETDFYEQYEFSFEDAQLPSDLLFIQQRSFLGRLKVKLERIFQVELGDRIELTAHKLIAGQRIRLHNDFVNGQETHRLLIQLNHGWGDEEGGFLLFFNSPDPTDIHKVFRPVHNSAVGFAISPNSNHAVSTIHGGVRLTIVCSFYG